MPLTPATAAAQTPRPGPPQDPAPTGCPSPSLLTRTLIVVRTLIDYGRQVAAMLKQGTTAGYLEHLTQCFATDDIAEILARIARALHIAAALEAKLLTYVGPPERPLPAARLPRVPRTGWQAAASAHALPLALRPADGAAGPVAPGGDGAESRLARLPSAEEIARMLRNRSIGAIIADLCLELGIREGTPEFQGLDLFLVMLQNGGNPSRLFVAQWKRGDLYFEQLMAKHGLTMQTPLWPEPPQGWSPGAPASGGTGPP